MNLQEKLKDELEKLSPKEKDVMSLRLGLDDGRPRTFEEIAHLFEISKEQIKAVEEEALSKSEAIVKETSIAFAYNSLKNCIFAEKNWDISSFDYENFRNDINEILSEDFSKRETKILDLRFGLSDGKQRTLKEISVETCLSKERIRQIECKVLTKLRNPKLKESLKKYLFEKKDK